MPTFKRKTETVDARQFDGTAEKAKELAAWFKENNPWYEFSNFREHVEKSNFGSQGVSIERPCVLTIYFDHEMMTLQVGDWLILNQDGTLGRQSDSYFKLKYEQV